MTEDLVPPTVVGPQPPKPETDQTTGNTQLAGSMGDPADFPGVATASGEPPPTGSDMGSLEDFPGVKLAPVGGSATAVTAAQGAVKGFTETTGLTAGGVAGFKLGMKVPLPHPGLKAALVTATTVAGALYGVFAGHKATGVLGEIKTPSGAPLTFQNIDDVPPRLRSAFIFGENMGAGVSFLAPQIIAAKVGVKVLDPGFAGAVFNSIMDDAKNRTKRFVGTQLISAAGAGVGGGISEELAPGELLPRVGAEVVVGIAAPGKLLLNAGGYVLGRIANLRNIFSESARQTTAAKLIQNIYKTAGDDIELAQKLLAESIKNDPDIVATVAQRLGTDPVIGLEKALISGSREFSAEAGRRAEATLDVFRDTIRILRGSGDKEALREAANIERRYFTFLSADRLNTVKLKAVEAAEDLLKAGGGNRAANALKAFNAAEEALEQARVVEKEFWNLVPGELSATTKSLVVAAKTMRGALLNNEKLPELLVKELADFAEAGGNTTVGYLKIFRSRMLAHARELGSDPKEATMAGVYGRMAEAALDDIDEVFKKSDMDGVMATLGHSLTAYNTARNYTRALHEAFTNSFTGKNLARGAKGLRLAPEALMKRAFATGKEVTDHRLAELAESTRFLPERGLGGVDAEKNLTLMLEAQESYFAIVAAELAGIKSGPAKTKAIERFISINPELNKRFPKVMDYLKNAGKTQEAVDAVAALNEKSGAILEKRTAWAKLSGTTESVMESPTDAIASGLRGRQPVRNLVAMAKLAKKHDAVDGFVGATFDHAFREASTSGGGFDFVKLRSVLFDPIRPGDLSIIEVLVKNGVFDESSVKALTTVLDKGDIVAKAVATSGVFVDVEGFGGFILQALAKIVGSHVATTGKASVVGASGGAGGIIVAAAGAKLGDKLINAIPAGKVKALLIEAVIDPELMLMLMAKPVGEAKILSHGLKLHSILVGLGVIPITPLALGGEDFITDIVN